MKLTKDDYVMESQMMRRGIDLPLAAVNTLRRAQLTLHRWDEQCCGDGNDWSSWSIERDEETDKPYFCVYPHDEPMYRRPTADREKGAERRVDELCKAFGLYWYHQSDPRGCALYVAKEPLNHQNYSSAGFACCV